ncbi:MAG TPA: Pls/PosA family non-ribosomal peptide synthetase [Verrucomicrobiae bacterium]
MPQPADAIPLTARPAAAAILHGPNRPDLLREETLGQVLSATARRQPEHPALIWGQRVVSYGELEAASNAVGGALAKRGVGPGKVAGLFLPRGADLLIAQAGIAKSGGAWLPFDADAPLERIKTCLQDAGAVGLVTSRDWLPRLKDFPLPVWALEDLLVEKNPVQPAAAGLSDPAYVIYTSGSTGQPKGIVISQRGICHFIRAENELLGVRADDRVYQGFSVAFDMSFEEIWISYLAGATLWIAPPSLVGDPEALAHSLAAERITVLHAVPTLASLLPELPPTVRLVNLGGEACPAALARRLVRPGRKVFNTYGPTEASVSASLAELKADDPVTIGMPLPNYGLLVVDAEGRPLAPGQVGELCIFGPGLALGYLNRPELTAEKFIPKPCHSPRQDGLDDELMYRTGDLARIEPGGPVYCLGRADSQVKIRGFRVELDEISATLSAQKGVAAAAVVLRTVAEMDQLVAFVVPLAGSEASAAQWRLALATRLPPYMVPAHFQMVSSLPRLASGKVDFNALRQLPMQAVPAATESVRPSSEDEVALFAALTKLFPGASLRPEADFFDDLGGHSLLAARLVSLLRMDRRYAALGVQEIYRERRLGNLAAAMQRQRAMQPAALPARAATPAHRRFLCGLAQAVVIPGFILLKMADWLAPFFVYHYFTGDPGDSIPVAVLYSLATFVLARLANFAVAIAGKRLTGPLRAGKHPLWGVTYFRWWLAGKFAELPDVYLIAGTPWMALYLRALGARIGRHTMVDTVTLGAPELVAIEDGASIGTFVNLENARVEAGELVIGRICLKKESVVASYAVLEEDTELGEGAQLCGQSALAASQKIPAGQIWDGAPARGTNESADPLPPRPECSVGRHWVLAILYALTAIVVSVLFFLPVFPAFMLIDWLDVHTLNVFDSGVSAPVAFGFYFLLAIPASALFLGATILLTAALRWLLPRQRAGMVSVHSFSYWHKRAVNLVLDSSLRELHGLYASVFAPLWLRFLGVKVGKHAEISTAEGMVPELLSLGDDSFIADGAMLGDEELRGGWMILKPTRIGHRSFIGNGAYVANGATVPDDVLIGVQTRTPKNTAMESGQTWMGSPPLLLPARETLRGFPESLTFRPSFGRRVGRGLVEGLRTVLPLALVIATGYLIVILVMPLAEGKGWGLVTLSALAVAGCIYGLASFLFVVALKWLLLGRYRPKAAPMWTPFVWISEAVTNLYESLAVPNFLDLFRGTPMLPWALRLLGTRIGRGVYLNTTDITEFDCVRIGDEAELNALCGPQTHLFEDRVMKIGDVHIGKRVTVGVRGTILYDTEVGDDTRLGPLTLVAKGERLPAGTRWQGSPATAVRNS